MVSEFEKKVDELVIYLKDKPIEYRKKVINDVCENHVLETGKKPDSYQLLRLSNVILQEDLSNPDVYKVQNTEYPFLSIPQKKRRKRREFTTKDSTLDYMEYKVSENLSTTQKEKM